jgi:hypothetical protein
MIPYFLLGGWGVGLPDVLFIQRKSLFGYVLDGNGITKCWYILSPFGMLSGKWVYFVVIWYILWSFGTFC